MLDATRRLPKMTETHENKLKKFLKKYTQKNMVGDTWKCIVNTHTKKTETAAQRSQLYILVMQAYYWEGKINQVTDNRENIS